MRKIGSPLKTLIFVFAAFALSAVTHQAGACDYGVHADNAAATVVVCDNGACAAVPTAQEAAATEPAAPKVADEPTDPAPITVADRHQ